MASFRDINDQRIRQLAETLKRNGLAASETEAVSMAMSMTRTESRVNETFNQKKDAAVMSTGGKGPSGTAGAMNTSSHQVFRDEEVSAQVSAAQRQPASPSFSNAAPQRPAQTAPIHPNNAIAEAISNVQQAYAEPQSIDIESNQLNENGTLADVVEHSPYEDQTPSPEPRMQEMIYTEPPQPEPEQNRYMETEPVVQEPQQARFEPAAVQQPEPVVQAQHVQQTSFAEQPPSAQSSNAPQATEEENMVEHTQEMTERPPKRDTSQYAESRISLADVFNINRKR